MFFSLMIKLSLCLLLLCLSIESIAQEYTKNEISLNPLALYDIDETKRNAVGVGVNYLYQFSLSQNIYSLIGLYGQFTHDKEDCINLLEDPSFSHGVFEYSNNPCEYKQERHSINVGTTLGVSYRFSKSNKHWKEVYFLNNISIHRWSKSTWNLTPSSPKDPGSIGFISKNKIQFFYPIVGYSHLLPYKKINILMSIFLGVYNSYTYIGGIKSGIRF